MNRQVRMYGLARQYAQHKEEFLDAVDTVYSSGQMLDGPFTQEFEAQIAARTNRKYAVAVNSGSTALLFAMMHYIHAIDGDRIAIPAVSFIATLNSILLTGQTPKFIDVDVNGIMDLNKLDLNKTKASAIMYVNLCGNLLDYDKLRLITSFFHDNQPIIEDAAQSFGAYFKDKPEMPSGKLGDVSVLSFDPTKNLPNFGSGGMLLTDDHGTYMAFKDFRDNGKNQSFMRAGINSKMSEADCAQMLVRLKYFDKWQARRSEIAGYYSNFLKFFVDVPVVPDNVCHAWSKYHILTPEAQSLHDYLMTEGIETKIMYQTPLPYADVNQKSVSEEFPGAVNFTQQALCLPIYPEMTDNEIAAVMGAIEKYYEP